MNNFSFDFRRLLSAGLTIFALSACGNSGPQSGHGEDHDHSDGHAHEVATPGHGQEQGHDGVASEPVTERFGPGGSGILDKADFETGDQEAHSRTHEHEHGHDHAH